MLEEADTDRSGGLDRPEFRSLIRKMRMMERREAAGPGPGPGPGKAPPPPSESLVFPAGAGAGAGVVVLPGVGPAVLHGLG
jgi:hypothetical protein